MLKPVYVAIFLLLSSGVLPAQRTDPYSTPPGAPYFDYNAEVENNRLSPFASQIPDALAPPPSNFVVIESQSSNSAHDMDQEWINRIVATGNTGGIFPQSTLDNTSFFAGTDVLIVSSGIIGLPAARVNTLSQWVQNGGPLYIQCEYLPSYTTNGAFATIVNGTGGSFAMGSTVAGSLVPTNALNTYATTPNVVAALPYHWYGCSGGGCNNIEVVMRYGVSDIGWSYCPTNPAYGSIVVSTDQDWLRTTTSTALVDNFIYHLITGPACTAHCGVPLEREFMSFVGELDRSGGVMLNWEMEKQRALGSFELIRVNEQGDEIVLTEIAVDPESVSYQWLDEGMDEGMITYKVRLLAQNGEEVTRMETVVANFRPEPVLRVGQLEGKLKVWLDGGTFSPVYRVSLYDLRGSQVYTSQMISGVSARVQIPMKDFQSAVYIIEVQSAEGKTFRKKVLWMK